MMINTSSKIQSKDISVVVQGAIQKNTIKECLRSIRTNLPESEIILSTWKGSDTSDLDADKIILNDDPGAVFHDQQNKTLNNINRQILSTQEGLSCVTRKYTLKIRSDMALKDDQFLSYFYKYPIRDPHFKTFKERIIISSLFTRDFFLDHTGYKHNAFLHISDWVFFGRSEDIIDYFSIPLAPEPDYSEYFKHQHQDLQRCYKSATWQFPPEQYIAMEYFKKFFPEINEIIHYAQISNDQSLLSSKLILNNFIILDPHLWKFESLKEQYKKATISIANLPPFHFETLYRTKIFNQRYSKRKNFKLDSLKVKHYLTPKNLLISILLKLQILGVVKKILDYLLWKKHFIIIFIKKRIGSENYE